MFVNFLRPLLRTLNSSSKLQRNCKIAAIWEKQYKNLYFCSNSQSFVSFRHFCDNITKNKAEDESLESLVPTVDFGDEVIFFVKNLKGELIEIKGRVGQSVLLATQKGGVNLAGACEGNLICTTCHMYIDEECESLVEEPSLEEEDLLDKAAFLKENSRLSCQIMLSEKLKGRVFTLPEGTVNFAVDGHVFESH